MLTRTVIVFFMSISLLSCKKDKDQVVAQNRVSFGYQSKTGFGGRAESETPHLIRLSVETEEGESIWNDKELVLNAFGQEYVTESVQLELGNYVLTSFLVINDVGEVIFAAPLEGSDQAAVVSHALPIDFEVRDNGQDNVIRPEVVPISEKSTPGSYGYMGFGFDIINNFVVDLNITSDFNGNPLPASVEITSYSSDSLVIHAWSFDYVPGVFEEVSLGLDAAFHRIQISSADHHALSYFLRKDFLSSAGELSLMMSPQSTMDYHTIASSGGDFPNEVGLYLPKDGCQGFCRLDGVGMLSGVDNFYLHISYGFYDETGLPLLFPNLVETFSGNTSLIFPNAQVSANEASDYCEEIHLAHPGTENYDIEVFILVDTGEDLHFAPYNWSSSAGAWESL